jgi:hypothetical protein
VRGGYETRLDRQPTNQPEPSKGLALEYQMGARTLTQGSEETGHKLNSQPSTYSSEPSPCAGPSAPHKGSEKMCIAYQEL